MNLLNILSAHFSLIHCQQSEIILMCFRARVPGDLTSCTLAPRSPVCPGLVTMLTTSFRKVFRSHGEFCSTQPWEVIVATLTFLVCILTVWGKHGEQHQEDSGNQTSVSSGPGSESPPWTLMELVVMTFIRCLALLHCYYHLKKVHRVGSSLIMKVILAYYGFTVLLYR